MWAHHKSTVLLKDDKSFKGSIDHPVREMVEQLNKSEDFLTTSSCSGRIMLINETCKDKRKNNSEFLFVSHDFVTAEELHSMEQRLVGASGNVFLKLEPLIVHVQCRSLERATWLLHLMKTRDQLKHSCIVSASNDKFIVSIKGLVKLEIPLIYDDVRIVDHSQLRMFVDIANERMIENFNAINSLTSFLTTGLLDNPSHTTSALDFKSMRPTTFDLSEHPQSFNPVRISEISIDNRLFELDHLGRFVVDLSLRRKIGINNAPDGSRPSLNYLTHLARMFENFLLIPDDDTSSLWTLCWVSPKPNHLDFMWHKIPSTEQIDLSRIQNITWEAASDTPSSSPFKQGYERFGNILVVENDDQVSSYWSALCKSKNCSAVVKRETATNSFKPLFNLRNDLIAEFRDRGTKYKVDFSQFLFAPLTETRDILADSFVTGNKETVLEICYSPDCYGFHLLAKKFAAFHKYIFVVPNKAIVADAMRACLRLNNLEEENVEIIERLTDVDTCDVTRVITTVENGTNDLKKISSHCPNAIIHLIRSKGTAPFDLPDGFTRIENRSNQIFSIVRQKH